MDNDMAGKTIVVTGATSGIGLAVAEILARQGAAIIGIGRSEERCRQAKLRLRSAYPNTQIEYCKADLSLQSQVLEAAAEIRQKVSGDGRTLYGLVNNAGTFTYWMTLTQEGFEMQWAVNHLAGFLLTHELLPLLEAAPLARVVTVSSASHYHTRLKWDDIQLRRRYNGLLAYRQTKLANVLFTAELNRRLGPGSRIKAFAADPGLVKTDIGLKYNPGLVAWIWKRRRAGGISPTEAAKGIAYLVSEEPIQDSANIYWKHASPKPPDPFALDEKNAQRLWALSERMCGIQTEKIQ